MSCKKDSCRFGKLLREKRFRLHDRDHEILNRGQLQNIEQLQRIPNASSLDWHRLGRPFKSIAATKSNDFVTESVRQD
jgi:hypothetical protein